MANPLATVVDSLNRLNRRGVFSASRSLVTALCKSLVARAVTLFLRKQAFMIGEKQVCGVSQHSRIHVGCSLRLSGT
jgi:hypothetical protein